MDGQRQRTGWGRGRRRKAKNTANTAREAKPEPVRIAARRPDSPLIVKAPPRTIAASAVPKKRKYDSEAAEPISQPKASPEPRRIARIVRLNAQTADDREKEREKLLGRLMQSDGRGAISRAANEFLDKGFELPEQQTVHLQLLEHFDESRARSSLEAMCRLLTREPPIKRPVLDQRLRRLEEHADEAQTRELAAELRRTLRA